MKLQEKLKRRLQEATCFSKGEYRQYYSDLTICEDKEECLSLFVELFKREEIYKQIYMDYIDENEVKNLCSILLLFFLYHDFQYDSKEIISSLFVRNKPDILIQYFYEFYEDLMKDVCPHKICVSYFFEIVVKKNQQYFFFFDRNINDEDFYEKFRNTIKECLAIEKIEQDKNRLDDYVSGLSLRDCFDMSTHMDVVEGADYFLKMLIMRGESQNEGL